LNKILLVFLCYFLGLTGCAPWATKAQVSELQNAENHFNQRKYGEAVNAYRKLLTESPAPTPAVAANARYDLAFVLAYYDNPQRNYMQAVQELEEFLSLYPDHARAREAQNLRFVLKAFLDVKKENEHLNKSIEQLKKLDIRHEERRNTK
jgi:outer membrane protein assembly factor BamD (BamD/ComL family)